jgi:hypothetical protein
LPKLQHTLDTVDLDGMDAHRTELEARVAAIERDGDTAALATAREAEQWQKVQQMEKMLGQADSSDPMVQEMSEKLRLIKGRLLWDFSASYKARLWKAHKELRELDVAYKEARRRWVLIDRAREDYPARTEEFQTRVIDLKPRIDGLVTRLASVANQQNQYLAAIAVRELESQKERIAAYSLQARFALASIYDRAASSTAPAAQPNDQGGAQ